MGGAGCCLQLLDADVGTVRKAGPKQCAVWSSVLSAYDPAAAAPAAAINLWLCRMWRPASAGPSQPWPQTSRCRRRLRRAWAAPVPGPRSSTGSSAAAAAPSAKRSWRGCRCEGVVWSGVSVPLKSRVQGRLPADQVPPTPLYLIPYTHTPTPPAGGAARGAGAGPARVRGADVFL